MLWVSSDRPIVANRVLNTSSVVNWWYIGIGAVLMFGGAVQLAEAWRGPPRLGNEVHFRGRNSGDDDPCDFGARSKPHNE